MYYSVFIIFDSLASDEIRAESKVVFPVFISPTRIIFCINAKKNYIMINLK